MARTLKSTERRAAHRLHSCWCCGGRIAQGDRYIDDRVVDGGSVYTLRLHRLCEGLWLDCGADEDWSWECGQEALSEWARGFVNSVAMGGAR